MSTRCQIEICYEDGEIGCLLYHHSDGYPSFMEKKLKAFLDKAYEYLTEKGYPYWWDPERVGALLILFSVEDYTTPILPYSTNRPDKWSDGVKDYRVNSGIPIFQPSIQYHGDIEFVWKVVLKRDGKYEISHTTDVWNYITEKIKIK